MAMQLVPYAEQNASHSAALFRQSETTGWVFGGPVLLGELAVSQQSTPNMSVVLGPGRGKVPGTSVSPPSGLLFTTQAMYDVLNDANLTLTVATSNPTNPRIDVAYVGVQDSFYSGSTNTAVSGIATGVASPTPAVPAIPSNAIAVAQIAVGAGVTSIVAGNIAPTGVTAAPAGGFLRAATKAALTTVTGTYDVHATVVSDPTPSNNADYSWNGTTWVPLNGLREYDVALSIATGAGTRTIVSQVIPTQPYAQRVLVLLTGAIAIASGTGASSLPVTATGGTVTLSGGPVVTTSNSGVAYVGLATVDIPASTACTVTISATNSVTFGGNASLRVLRAGEY